MLPVRRLRQGESCVLSADVGPQRHFVQRADGERHVLASQRRRQPVLALRRAALSSALPLAHHLRLDPRIAHLVHCAASTRTMLRSHHYCTRRMPLAPAHIDTQWTTHALHTPTHTAHRFHARGTCPRSPDTRTLTPPGTTYCPDHTCELDATRGLTLTCAADAFLLSLLAHSHTTSPRRDVRTVRVCVL